MKSEKQLYQWDVNQHLTELQPTTQFVDYPIGNELIRIKADGTRCRIPDEVLQTDDEKTCYERYQDGTLRAYSFNVQSSPKPPDYVYTAEEHTTFDSLVTKADAAIEEIKHRADSGEFTPKKGVDYFTDADKTEMMDSVSSGAVGEFREVVNAATAEYNANAAEKLESYNQNHTEKVAEYNQNAETKTAEFDANAAALQTEVDRLRGECDTLAAEKANVDGYYEEMTVGDAEQLISTQFVEDNNPYLFRPTGGSSDVGNRAYIDKIVGGTVAWNQLVDFHNESALFKNGELDATYIDGKWYFFNYQTDSTYAYFKVQLKKNHKYFLKFDCDVVFDGDKKPAFGFYDTDYITPPRIELNSGNNKMASIVTTSQDSNDRLEFRCQYNDNNCSITVYSMIFVDLTQMFGTTIADYIYSLEQSQAGAGVAWFKKLFPKDYYAYNAGELLSVEGLQSHDTVGFNAFDIATNKAKLLGGYQYEIVGAYTSVSYEDVSGNVETLTITNRLFTPTNNGTLNVVGADSTTCVHLVWSGSRNGEYEPYVKHSYPLDSSLTLRGIPKLDASNNLYYDGDEYTSDGKVNRKYGIIDLGTIDWVQGGSNNKTSWVPISWRTNVKPVQHVYDKANILCNKYYTDTATNVEIQANDKTISVNKKSWVYIYDSAYVSATPQEFKAAMSGVYLVYELATPTTETAEPFHNIQIVDDFGTEELVSTGIVPVGHKTRYPANLRDKLQHLPSLANADGTYLIQQSGKQMSLVYMPAVFPETPTDDGTYTLKTVVTGGVATLQWVAE